MLIDELREAMSTAVEEQPFLPDLDGLNARASQLRRRRVTSSTLGTAVSAALVVGIIVVANSGGPAMPGRGRVVVASDQRAIAATISEVDNWGPTRGSLARDGNFLDQVRQEWDTPSGDYYGNPADSAQTVSGSSDGSAVLTPLDGSRHLTGDVHVLFAGDTADGPAAVVAQQSSTRDVGVYLGFLLPVSGQLRLVAAFTPTLYAQSDSDSAGFDTKMISFHTGLGGEHLVVLPADPADEVSVSLTHTLDPSGHVERQWAAAPVEDGIATVSTSGPLGLWDTLIRIKDHGTLVDENRPWDVLAVSNAGSGDATPPVPDNVIDWPLADQFIGGSVPGGGYPANFLSAWVTHYANADEPYGEQWWLSGSPQDGDPIAVAQLWFYGDTARTVVLRAVGHTTQLLSDAVTDPSARPQVFLRLPDDQGWLVVGGPDTTITGYRLPGTDAWTDVPTSTASTTDGKPVTTKASAFIPVTGEHVQVRLDVAGRTQIASR